MNHCKGSKSKIELQVGIQLPGFVLQSEAASRTFFGCNYQVIERGFKVKLAKNEKRQV
jgi:hypothetical protein